MTFLWMVVSQVTAETGIRKINAEFFRYQNQIGKFSKAVRVEIGKKKRQLPCSYKKNTGTMKTVISLNVGQILFGLE